MKVFIVGGDILIERMFGAKGYDIVPEAENADLICFTGGSDVTPSFYGDALHHTTRYDLNRDEREAEVFEKFRDTPKVGICRGGQFLNVMSGGKLFQDVDNHAIGGTHGLRYIENGSFQKYDVNDDEDPNRFRNILVTSTHHQMMKPDLDKGELWGYCYRSAYRDTGDQNKRRTNRMLPDVEIVHYPDTKSLCFQPHPEYSSATCRDLFFTCLDRAFPQA